MNVSQLGFLRNVDVQHPVIYMHLYVFSPEGDIMETESDSVKVNMADRCLKVKEHKVGSLPFYKRHFSKVLTQYRSTETRTALQDDHINNSNTSREQFKQKLNNET